MRLRSAKLNAVREMALERDLIPLTNLFRIQVVDHRQSIKLVETGSYITIFDVRQTAQVNNEVGAPSLARQFITCSLHVSIGQAEAFAGPAKPRAGLHVRSGKFSWVAQTSNRHGSRHLSVMFTEQWPVRQKVI